MEGTAILSEGVVHLAPEYGPQDFLFEMHNNKAG
jgi:isoleucyl-tRNA synthetase